jgi:hypothetical protein
LGVSDRGPGCANRGELGGEDLIAVQENLYVVPTDDWGAGIGLQRRIERRLAQLNGRKFRDGGVDVSAARDDHQCGDHRTDSAPAAYEAGDSTQGRHRRGRGLARGSNAEPAV